MTTRRLIALASAGLLLLAACSSSPTDTAQGDRSRLGGKKGAAKQGKAPKKVLKEAAKVGKKAGGAGTGSKSSSVTGSKAAGKPPAGSTSQSSEIRPEYARRSATITDPRDDAKKQGVTPDYAEIIEASIQGLGDDVRLTMTLAGQVPDRSPDDKTHMIVAFGVTGSKDNEGYSFGAQARPEGWQAYAGGRDDSSGEFPGTFKISGSQIVMTIPWDYIRGPRAFEWYAASNWFRQLANTTHYRVDLAPSDGLAKFPQ